MRTAILHTICSHPQVKGSLRLTALNIAYKCNGAGIGRVAYRYLAKRTGLHVRTIMRHVAKLGALGVLVKTVTRLSSKRCMLNLYQFILPTRACDRPPSRTEKGRKPLTREEITRLKQWLAQPDTPRGIAYQATVELLRQYPEGHPLTAAGSAPDAPLLADGSPAGQ